MRNDLSGWTEWSLPPHPDPFLFCCAPGSWPFLMACKSPALGFLVGLAMGWHLQETRGYEESEVKVFLPCSSPLGFCYSDTFQPPLLSHNFVSHSSAHFPWPQFSLGSGTLFLLVPLWALKSPQLNCLSGVLLTSGTLPMIQICDD